MSLLAYGKNRSMIKRNNRIFIGRYDDLSEDNWILEKGFSDMSNPDLYIVALYFTVTTIVTVGYGDISAYTSGERVFCVFLMLAGVISFSFATGTLASLISSYDSKNGQLKEKMDALTDIQEEYNLDIDLYNEISKNIQYNHRKKSKDLIKFMDDLPYKLRVELAMIVHQRMYSSVVFFSK